MGGIGAVAEPLVVITLLFGGTWINRSSNPGRHHRRRRGLDGRRVSEDDVEVGDAATRSSRKSADSLTDEEEDIDSRSTSPSLLPDQEPEYRVRTVGIFGWKKQITTPNTRKYRTYFLSRLLERYPFLVECWYWGLIYWVYQLARAATAVFIVDSTIITARNHALQLIRLEQKLHIFIELPIQRFFLGHEFLLKWINRTYSFIHIPGSIAFLVWLFWFTHVRKVAQENASGREEWGVKGKGRELERSEVKVLSGKKLYQARRRTMAFCNLLAFIIFTIWPCMPPRLLSADTSDTEFGKLARSYGFMDTVHGPHGEGSIWTDNRFTNKFAAMPSLHFGYSLLIGLTIMTLPLSSSNLSPSNTNTNTNGVSPHSPLSPSSPTKPHHSKSHSSSSPTSRPKSRSRSDPSLPPRTFILPLFNRSHPALAPKITLPALPTLPSRKRAVCLLVGAAYPSLILTAIIATANHFILDAVAGAMVCGIAWWGNGVLLNLLAVEDWFLRLVRVCKPGDIDDDDDDDDQGTGA